MSASEVGTRPLLMLKTHVSRTLFIRPEKKGTVDKSHILLHSYFEGINDDILIIII